MTENRTINSMEIEALLDNILLQRDIFNKDVNIDIWKSAYFGVYGVCTLLRNQIQQKIWQGTNIELPLKNLKKTTNRYIRKFRKQGKIHGAWSGCSETCNELILTYQNQCKPLIQTLVDKLDKNHPIRRDINEKYPGMFN